jgi:hypothetical protein
MMTNCKITILPESEIQGINKEIERQTFEHLRTITICGTHSKEYVIDGKTWMVDIVLTKNEVLVLNHFSIPNER